jgi:hypothetical protein
MLVRTFSGVCVAQSSVLCELVIFCQYIHVHVYQLPMVESLIVYTTDWELHVHVVPLLVNNLKGSIYYFNHNIWYKYTGTCTCIT